MTTKTIQVDPATVLFFSINALRGGVDKMNEAIDAQDADRLTEAIEGLVSAATGAKEAIDKGALENA